ncbi:MAG: type II secretion system protein GspG [Planctomycetaceae bacterium]|jgi:general secretion pathway protein G
MSDGTGTRRATWVTIVRGSVGTAVAWSIFGFVIPHVAAMQTRHEIDVTRATMAALSAAIVEYSKDHRGQYPSEGTNLAALVDPPAVRDAHWRGRYLDHVPRDAWGNEFLYMCPGVRNPGGFDVTSSGPDCVLGNADDIMNSH